MPRGCSGARYDITGQPIRSPGDEHGHFGDGAFEPLLGKLDAQRAAVRDQIGFLEVEHIRKVANRGDGNRVFTNGGPGRVRAGQTCYSGSSPISLMTLCQRFTSSRTKAV